MLFFFLINCFLLDNDTAYVNRDINKINIFKMNKQKQCFRKGNKQF